MCGLTGIYNINQNKASELIITQMTDAIAHRGPDGKGVFLDGNLALGHRRLSILDISDNGAQPMSSNAGNWTIIFNGCVYNFKELKQELINKGHTFLSTTDTEVITEGLEAYGVSFFQRLDGMFAIAAWNKNNRKLYLSRDRFGIKPLYYWHNKNTFLFASEIKAFLKHPDFKVDVDLSALNEYFTFQNLFSYRTLFKGVAMIPPANTIEIDSNFKQVTHNSWWDYDFSKTEESMTFNDAKDETLNFFQKAVKRQMVSDVPVGAYLSGGMDSGAITAVGSKLIPRMATFTCGFDMSSVTGVEANYDERRDAELMANAFKTEHYEQVINAGDLSWSLPKVVYHLEDLKVGMSYPNYYISRLASKFVKVCLQGTGGDELYGGYPWRYYRVFDALNQEQFFNQYYGFWQRLVPDEHKSKLFNAGTFKEIDIEEPRQIFERVFTFNNKLQYDTPEQHINNSLYFEIKTFLPSLFLVGDKLSMAHGLEERFPFMDNDLVNFAQKIPVKHKLGNLTSEINKINENDSSKLKKTASYRDFDDGKNVLRKAMSSFMPENILNRKKQGFSAPDESWYRGENAAYVKELLLGKKNISAEFINPEYVKQIVNEHIDDHINHRLLIWSFMNFEWWCRIFLNGEKVE
ncbi:MAG TPA: asparagine synthase (glutamine-hydrolyzing) [Bacteroidia bacterium]|jgi:asparagine synthase (glutamine-hydrolysing)|nr:asparagine synthase (glutamine-hydrolyzing) [Bacteroidia bacterium]